MRGVLGMNYRKWLAAIGSLLVAAMALAAFWVVAFRLMAAAGAVAFFFVAIAILINGYIAKAEDDLPGGFNTPTTSHRDSREK